MENINRAIISGNLTRDPDLRQTPGGMAVLTFGVAVNDRRKDPSSGEWVDVPNYIDCTVFGNRANSLQRYLSKGMKVAVEGKLRWSQWERDGQKRSKVEIVADTVEFMSRQNAQSGVGAAYQQQPQQYPNPQQYGPQNAPQPAYGAGQQPQYYDQDIPF